ncbi:response regulator [Parasediminibacterium sp. JCM 36343]|uniref:response regulator n=1 Tax=Parasediminibacterium sp. JCM 36343 TaxID=3374279 RepID=UPI00397C3170
MKKILLIEDNTEMRENIQEILTLAGYAVTAASNGKEGVAFAQSEKPDLIVCDIMMPLLDGYGVLHMLSRQEKTASVPFIFLTAKAEKSDFRKGMEMGADDYVTKPFEDVELLNAIESRLRKTEILKKEFSKDIQGLDDFISDVKGIETLKELAAKRELKSYRKKDDIYKEGSYPRGVYFIEKGKVKTGRQNDNGKELITGLYKEGEFFGYLALLEDSKYNETATVLEDADIYLLPREEFNTLIYHNPHVAAKFIKMLSNSLGDKESQLVKLAYNSVRKKVADALVTLHDRFNKESEKTFTINISREDLANIAGTATESTIRTLSDFKDEKLVEVQAGKITLLDYKKLLTMRD